MQSSASAETANIYAQLKFPTIQYCPPEHTKTGDAVATSTLPGQLFLSHYVVMTSQLVSPTGRYSNEFIMTRPKVNNHQPNVLRMELSHKWSLWSHQVDSERVNDHIRYRSVPALTDRQLSRILCFVFAWLVKTISPNNFFYISKFFSLSTCCLS